MTAGCGEGGRACNRRAVARSLCDDSPSSRFGSACTTCEAWPPCHRMGTLVRAGGDLARDASGHERGNLPLKNKFIPRAVAMPRFSCIHCALSPSVPLDGARRCSLEGSASGPPPQQSLRWGACAFCFLRGGAVDLVFFLLLLEERDLMGDRKSTRLNSSHSGESRMPSSA